MVCGPGPAQGLERRPVVGLAPSPHRLPAMAPSLVRCGQCAVAWLRLPTAPPYCPACGAGLTDPPSTLDPTDDADPPSRRSTITVRDLPVAGAPDDATGRLAGVAMQAGRARVHVRVVTEAPDEPDPDAEYAIAEVLARGGMGEVLAARQVNLDRDVVIKRLPAGSADADARARFLAEAVVTGNLDHPNIVPIHELAIDQYGRPFYTMKRIRGQTWSARWRALALDENLDVLMRICDAVAFAHARGVVHRDLKPENVMLGDFGEVLVVDWGLAVSIAELRRDRTAQRLACGTPAYMAPEMATGDYDRIGPVSDVYLLGATLYELLTGVPPHPGEDPHASIRAAADNLIDPLPPAGELGDIVRRAMASEPADRYVDVKAFQAALRAYRAHAQSGRLADSAAAALERAREGSAASAYDDFARSMYGYEEAAMLWPGNQRARDGATAARHAYAERALAGGDLDLAAGLAPGCGDQALVQRIAAARARRHLARRRLHLLTATSAGLMLLVVAVLGITVVIARAERQQVVRAARARDAAESRLRSLEDRTWAMVLHSDFDAGLPPVARVLTGRWQVRDGELVAQGPGPAGLLLTPPIVGNLRLTYDWSVQLPHRVHLEVPADAQAPGAGLTVVFAGDCRVRRGEEELARAPLPPPIPDLPQHLRVEWDGGRLLVLVDGREVLRTEVGAADPLRPCLAFTASPGATFDNLHVEALDLRADAPRR